MKRTRRQFVIGSAEAIAALGFVGVSPDAAQACLLGTWILQCRVDGQRDEVNDGTCQHKCSRDQSHQFFNGDWVLIVCPAGHVNDVNTGRGINQLVCPTEGCGRQCRRDRDERPPRPDRPDRGGRSQGPFVRRGL
jgi:hypothetical protein